jgi:FemAB-related protein (PEP-CTERM system-associated)
MSAVRVERFEGSAAEWDDAVRRFDGWTHVHLHGWRTVIQRTFGHECPYLVARRADGTLAGMLPLVRVRSLLFGHYLVSMPFLNYGGPLGDADAIRALTDHASEMAKRERVKLLELRSRRELDVSLEPSHRKITMLLDLPAGDPDLLFKKLDSKLRSQIRKPQKEGVTIRFGADQVVPFFHVFARHMRDLGTPTLPLRFFKAIAEQFPESAWFGCAYLGDEPVAAGCALQWGEEVEITWASSLIAHKKLAANMLLYWALLERSVREGARVFNFGRCTPGSGTHKFKQQWGARPEQLWWYGASSAPGATTPSPNDGAYSLGPRVWRRLPPPIATALGPHIVRGIP